jgi:hypothetical protein
LEDPTVAPHHARLEVSAQTIAVGDLGSEGGVFVNNSRIAERHTLASGDTLAFGNVVFCLTNQPDDELRDSEWPTRLAVRPSFTQPPPKPTHGSAELAVLASLIDEALALGRADAIAPILATRFARVAEECEAGMRLADEGMLILARYALKMAAVTEPGDWFNLLVRVYLARGEVVPLEQTEAWFVTLSRAQGVDWPCLRRYVALVRSRVGRMSLVEQRAAQRIERLLRLEPGVRGSTDGSDGPKGSPTASSAPVADGRGSSPGRQWLWLHEAAAARNRRR